MQQYQTQNGHRPDLELELQALNPYLGYIGSRILPMSDVGEKGGTMYYQVLQADSAAQTNRTITDAPTRVNITENSTTFSCGEKIKGYTIPRSTVKTQFKTIERADRVGSKASLRSVARLHDADVAAVTLVNASAPVVDILGSFVGAAQTGLEAVRRYRGSQGLALATSFTVFNRIMRYTEIVNRFSLSSASLDGIKAEDIIARKPAALKMLLASIIGVDEILVGDDDQWYDASAAYQDRAAIVALPDPAEMSEIEEPVFGKTVRFAPEGQDYPFRLESFYDDDNKLNKYDALVWYQLKVLNAPALYILKGIDEGNAVTTSTTEA